MIHQLREKGETITATARGTGMDRKTVRKYLQRELERPSYGPRVIDPYREYLRERLMDLRDGVPYLLPIMFH